MIRNFFEGLQDLWQSSKRLREWTFVVIALCVGFPAFGFGLYLAGPSLGQTEFGKKLDRLERRLALLPDNLQQKIEIRKLVDNDLQREIAKTPLDQLGLNEDLSNVWNKITLQEGQINYPEYGYTRDE